MSYLNPHAPGDKGKSKTRYRAGSFGRIPFAPHQLQERVTPTHNVFVLCHLGVPQLDADSWSLRIDGLVVRPLRVGFSNLAAYPRCTIPSFHPYCGSSLKLFEPTRRIANGWWSGVRLSDLLRDCEPSPEAKYLWLYGVDYGEFDGRSHETYVKDLPLDRVPSDVLIAYELNGAPLPAEHGFPARLMVPGFYGTNSVKWLTRMTVAEARATGPLPRTGTTTQFSPLPEGILERQCPGGRSPRNPSSCRRHRGKRSSMTQGKSFGDGHGQTVALSGSRSASTAARRGLRRK